MSFGGHMGCCGSSCCCQKKVEPMCCCKKEEKHEFECKLMCKPMEEKKDCGCGCGRKF